MRATNPYRRNVLRALERVVSPLAPVGSALDFGCGDGWFSRALLERGLVRRIVPVDIRRREQSLVEPVIYDGDRLPFADRSFELALAVDVLHHCPDPRASLLELSRCSGRYLLLKDHTYRSRLGRLALAILDELGNRRFGVVSVGNYQRGWEWLPLIEEQGFAQETLLHPLTCESRPPISWFSHHLQFVGLWRRC